MKIVPGVLTFNTPFINFVLHINNDGYCCYTYCLGQFWYGPIDVTSLAFHEETYQ